MKRHNLIFKPGALLERLAVAGSGRRSAHRLGVDGEVILYPFSLTCSDVLDACHVRPGAFRMAIGYDDTDTSLPGKTIAAFSMLRKLVPRLTRSRRLAIVLTSYSSINPIIAAAIAAARLMGVNVDLYDHCYRTRRDINPLELIDGSVTRIFSNSQVFDTTFPDTSTVISAGLCDCSDIDHYAGYKKAECVPRLIVAGDWQDRMLVSLLRRSHEQVKSKYPRCEWYLLSTSRLESTIRTDVSHAIETIYLHVQHDLDDIFSRGDSLLLLSDGGFNRQLLRRARIAGFPVLLNGFSLERDDCCAGQTLTVTRNSYGAIAEALLRLVEHPEQYQRFAS